MKKCNQAITRATLQSRSHKTQLWICVSIHTSEMPISYRWLHQGKFMDAKWVKAPTLAALQVAKYMRTVCEVIKLMLEKKMLFNFFGADFVAPKSSNRWKTACIRADLGKATKIKMKNTRPKNITWSFISCCFILVFTCSRYHFPQIFRTSFIQHYLKKMFFNGFTQTPPPI